MRRRARLLAGAAIAALFVGVVAGAAADPVLRLVSEDATTVTLGWDPVSGAEGFRFSSSASSKRSHTWDGARTSVRFAKADSYMVERIDTSVVGVYPGVPPPPPPPPSSGFSFQKAYDVASPGATIQVPPGQVVTDAPARGSATIFGGATAVTFECQDPNGLVTIPAAYPRLTIKASNVTLRGACFRLRDLWIGEPGDDVRTASNVVVDGVRMQGLEIIGAKATIRNSEIGPNVLCYSQSSSQPAAMKCDPNGPAYEAEYANRGTDDLSFQPFFHNNSGGVRSEVLFENNRVHDIQTKDADRLHTGCGLVWQPSGGNAPLGEITIRGNRYERCAVLGILFSATDGVVLENNWMGPPVEPLSNPNGGQPAGDFTKEIIARDIEGYDRTRHWRVSGNTLCHGTRAGQPAEDVVFSDNDLGRADVAWAGASYVNNRNVGASC